MNLATLLFATIVIAANAFAAPPREDVFTPLIAVAPYPTTQPVQGSDGKYHAVYELRLTNAKAVDATLQSVAVIDARDPRKVYATYSGADFEQRLRLMSNKPGSPVIKDSEERLLLIDLTFDRKDDVPQSVLHRFTLTGAPMPGRGTNAVPYEYAIAQVTMDRRLPIVVAPPLSGTGWVAYNGCCGIGGAHRASSQPVNGDVYYAQRFAIDFIRIDQAGMVVKGNEADVANYPGYGADIRAVADGIVIEVLNTLDDQTPPKLPDPATITLANVDGNHVVVDMGGSRFAFYAHMRKGSVPVKVGDRVKRGDLLGKLGNTGNTSAPHLHFHIMDGPSVLGSNGVPFVFEQFSYAGLVPAPLADDLTKSWSSALFPTPQLRRNQLPLDNSISTF
jgi:hypothetical protein